jgi:hypothetical protein
VILIALALLTLPSTHGAAIEGGKDVNPEGNDVPFSVVDRDSPSVDKVKWNLAIEMSQEAYDNGTTFEIITQVCTNDGVCDPPTVIESQINDRVHSISITPPSDHTYVNWRVKATDSEGNNTNYPHGDWFKTWSSCWYNDGNWGGVNALDDGCDVNEEDAPGFTAVASIAALGLGLIAISRREGHQK